MFDLCGVEVAHVLDVEYRRQVAVFEVYLFEKIAGLVARRNRWRIEVVSATDKSVLTCLIEVVVEVLVKQ